MFKSLPEKVTDEQEFTSDVDLTFADRIVLKMMAGVRGAKIDSSNAWDAPADDENLMEHYRTMRSEGKLDEPFELEKPAYLTERT